MEALDPGIRFQEWGKQEEAAARAARQERSCPGGEVEPVLQGGRLTSNSVTRGEGPSAWICYQKAVEQVLVLHPPIPPHPSPSLPIPIC